MRSGFPVSEVARHGDIVLYTQRLMTACMKLIRPQQRPYPREGDEDLSMSVRHPQMHYHMQYCNHMRCYIMVGLTRAPVAGERVIAHTQKVETMAPSIITESPRCTIVCEKLATR
jgi:hypothetical protein